MNLNEEMNHTPDRERGVTISTGQSFENHPELAEIIEWFANNVSVPGTQWSKLLSEINNALAGHSSQQPGDAVEFAEWVGRRCIHVGYDCWRDYEGIKFTTTELYSLFKQQGEVKII